MVRATCQFRHYAAIGCMHRLARYTIRQQLAVVNNSCSRVVAATFYRKNTCHFGINIAILSPKVAILRHNSVSATHLKRIGKYISKLLRFQFRLLSGLYLLLFIQFLLLLNPTIQSYVGSQFAHFLSFQWRTKVVIDHVQFKPLRTFTISGLYIEDHYGDTLLAVDELRLELKRIRFLKKEIEIKSLAFRQFNGHFSRRAYEDAFNFQFLINYFGGPQKDTLSSAVLPFRFKIDNISFQNSRLSLNDDTRPPLPGQFDLRHFDLKGLHLSLSALSYSADSASAQLSGLRFVDESGFQVDNATFMLSLLPDQVLLSNFKLNSPSSTMRGDLGLSFGEYADFNAFTERVRIRAQLDQLQLSRIDLNHLFGPRAPQLPIRASGNISGRLANLRARDLQLFLGGRTYLSGQVNISGLPDYKTALYDARLQSSYFDREEVLTAFPRFTLPPQFVGFNHLRFSGDYFGYPADFVANGYLDSDVGAANSDINIKLRGPASTYAGQLELIDIDLQKLTQNEQLGLISMQAEVKGKGDRLANFESQLTGGISRLDYKGYAYSQLNVDGYLDKQMFTGKISSLDTNAHFEFYGLADLSTEQPFFNFVAEVERIDFNALKLTTDSFSLKGFMEICATGIDIDSINGELSFRNLELVLNQRPLHLEEINVVAAFQDQDQRRLNFESPLGNAYFVGRFTASQLPQTLSHYFNHYVKLPKAKLLTDSNQYFELNIDLQQAQAVADFVYPGLYDIGSLGGHAYFDVANSTADFDLRLGTFRRGNLRVNNLQLFGSSSIDSLNLDLYADTLWSSAVLLAQDISLENIFSHDSMSFALRAMGETANNSLDFNGLFQFRDESAVLHLLPSQLQVYNNIWQFEQTDNATFRRDKAIFPGLGLRQANQLVYMQGVASSNRADTLRLLVEEVDIAQLNPLLAIYDVQVEGDANINLKASSLLSKAGVFGRVAVDDFVLDGKPMGNLALQSDYSVGKKLVDLSAYLIQSTDTLVNLTGTLGDLEANQQLDLHAHLQGAPLHPLRKILAPVFTDLSGTAVGDLRLSGGFKKLDLTGEASIRQGRMKVDFLEQYYNVSERVTFTNGSINFEETKVSDDQGGSGTLSGQITHQNFRKTQLGLTLTADNLLVLNTEPNYTDPYFGIGKLTGTARFKGPVNLIDINIRAAADKGTRFSIPLDGEANRDNLDFITFVNHDLPEEVVEERRFELVGVNFGMNLTATPDAEINILFDRVAGDIIRGRGNTALEVNINPQGELSMFGDYAFSSGDYTFTLANIPSKRFRIVEGSTIRWTGDPYDAELNLSAVYRQRASVAALLTEGQLNTGRTRTQMNVDTYLKLTGSLLSPTISFEIKLPTINENDTSDPLVARIQNINNNEQELNNQVLALLVAGQFFPSDNLVSTSFLGSTGANSLTEVLSNQINALLSQMFDNVNIGINYRNNNLGGATAEANRNDINLAMNTTLFNDRVLIDGNVGNAVTPGANAQELAGEVTVEYLISPDGSFRVKAFNKLDDRILFNRESNYRQGVGISYTENYNTTAELLEKPKRFFQDRLLRRIPWLPEAWKGDF